MSNEIEKPMTEYNMQDIQSQIEVNFYSHVPMMLLGVPGIGKTEIIKETAYSLLHIKTKEIETIDKPVIDKKTGEPKRDKDGNVVTKPETIYQKEIDGKTDRRDIKGNKIPRYRAYQAKHSDGWFNIDCSQVAEEGYVLPYIDTAAANDPKANHLRTEMLAEIKALKRWLEDKRNNGRTAIFFVDEITSASQGDQRTLMNFINQGTFPDGTKFDTDRVFFILAGNPNAEMPGYENSDAATQDIEQAVFTRCMTYFVKPDLDMFLDWGRHIDPNGRHNIHPYLISALEKSPADFMKSDKAKDVRMMTPRTLKKLSDYLFACEDLKHQHTELEPEEANKLYGWQRSSIEAAVGVPAAVSLCATLSSLDKMVSVKDLFGDEKSPKLDKASVAKFEALSGFEQTYIALLAVDDILGIDYTKKNNYLKLHQLFHLDYETNETPSTILNAIYGAPEGSIAGTIMDVSQHLKKYGIPEKYNLGNEVIKQAREEIALKEQMAEQMAN